MKTNLRWAGGKHYQKKDIVSLVQKDCEIFIDAFCGGLSVTLGLENSPHRLDIANDLFDELINYYNVVKFYPKDLYNKLHEIPYSVTSFDWASDWKYTEKYSLPPDEVEYAAKFFIRNRMSRDGLGKEFTTSPRLRRGMPEMESSYLTAIESIFDLHTCIKEKIFCRIDALHIIRCFKDCPECTIYCLHPNSKVRKYDESIVDAKDIRIGDFLAPGRQVKNIFTKKYSGDIVKIKGVGLPIDVETTVDHLIMRIPKRFHKRQDNRTNDERWNSRELVRADNLEKGDYILVPVDNKCIIEYNPSIRTKYNNCNKNFQISLNNIPELYRLIGYYAAEGHTTPWSTIFSFGTHELNTYVKDCCDCIRKVFSIDPKVHAGPSSDSVTQITIHSAPIAEFFKEHVSGTAINKKLKEELMTLNPTIQKEILIGWIRGDGGICYQTRNRTKLTGTTASYEMSIQMYQIALRCGLKPCYKNRSGSKLSNTRLVRDVYFTSCSDIRSLGFESFVVKDRTSRRIINGFMMVRITNIEKYHYCGDVIDFDVDGDDMFCSPFAIIHNCDPPYYYSKTSKRRTKHLYAVEPDQLFHSIFLNHVMNSKAQIIISGYSEELYEDALADWDREEKIVNMNMGGGTDKKAKRTEVLWYNRL